ncbi:MAG: HEAT repeat domain-containing protein [Acidobacteriota bacterium]
MTKKRKAAKTSTSARKPKRAAMRSTRAAMSVATSARGTVKERVAALAEVPLAVCESDKDLQAMLKVLRNKDEPVEVRLAALQSLAAAAFSVIAFESCRSDYIATLREVAEDPNPEIRQRVLGLLAREKDGFAQKKLLEGLKNPEKALVPPEKALQLLSYDVHAEAYSLARDIVSKPPNADAKREALRLLAADATSAPLFEKLLRDKDESAEIRQISASALHALKPEKLQEHAREMLLDKSEYEDIQATSLTALTQFGDDAAIADDKALLKSVDRLSVGKASSKYKQSARRFLSKYGQ